MNKDNKFNNLIGWIRDNYSDNDMSISQDESGDIDCKFKYKEVQFYIFYYHPDRGIDLGITGKSVMVNIASINLATNTLELVKDIFRSVFRTVRYMRKKINE